MEMLKRKQLDDNQLIIELKAVNSYKETQKELSTKTSIISLIKQKEILRAQLEKAGAEFNNFDCEAFLNGVRFRAKYLNSGIFYVKQGVK